MRINSNILMNTKLSRKLAGCIPVTSEGILCFVESKNHPGYYVFPKGGIETGETDEAAALRETLEEAGLEGSIVSDLGMRKHCHWYVMRVEKVHESWLENRHRIWVIHSSWYSNFSSLTMRLPCLAQIC